MSESVFTQHIFISKLWRSRKSVSLVIMIISSYKASNKQKTIKHDASSRNDICAPKLSCSSKRLQHSSAAITCSLFLTSIFQDCVAPYFGATVSQWYTLHFTQSPSVPGFQASTECQLTSNS